MVAGDRIEAVSRFVQCDIDDRRQGRREVNATLFAVRLLPFVHFDPR
jgi:hypothetical protein